MTIADIRRILQDADSALGGRSNVERLNECAAALINAIRDIDTNLPELGAERPAAIAKLSQLRDAGALKDYLPATRLKTAFNYFKLAWFYYRLKSYDKEEKAYRHCLELDPRYRYANNNFGCCLQRQKRYEEALVFFDKSIELGTDGNSPYHNKFELLEKLGRTEELRALVKNNPDRFKAKKYRTKLENLRGDQTMPTDIDVELKKYTDSDFAGEIRVSDNNSGIQLYEHQSDAIRNMSKKIPADDSFAGLLVLPTGGGKTLTATYWLMRDILDKGGKIIWLAHRHELLNQAKRSFEKVCYRDITKTKPAYKWRVISGQHDKPVHIKTEDDIIIASKTSLYRGLNYLQNWIDANSVNIFLVIDEAHHATAGEYRKLIEGIRGKTPKFKMLGLTATPFRTAENEQGLLRKMFPDDIVYKIDLRDLINRGILSEPIFKSPSTGVNMATLFAKHNSEGVLQRIANDNFFDIDTIGKDAALAIAENAERNNAIVNEYVNNRDTYGQTIVFALNVDMAITLSKLFNDAGVDADFVVSAIRDVVTGITTSDKENEEKIDKFRNGKLQVLINVNILTEGIDLPKVQSVFLTRPTKSTILMTQMIGRALRGVKAGGTKEAYVVNFIDDWESYIAWVNPEQLFIDENVDFSENTNEAQKSAVRLISIAKLEEFAKLANETLDAKVAELAFVDRVPVGIYQFTYLEESGNEDNDDTERHCNILVYDCMASAYEQFLEWLPRANIADIGEAVSFVDTTLFGSIDLLLGYRKQDIVDIIKYYQQTQELPKMVYLNERKKYDIGNIAKHIIDEDLTESSANTYIRDEWDRANGPWQAFFGINNYKAFRIAINREKDRMNYEEEYEAPQIKPLTTKEKIRIQDLPLYEIRRRFPDIGEKLVAAVYAKYTDAEGYYFSAQSGYKSKNKLDFHIDHILPMSRGGLTELDNLQLLTRSENLTKGNR